MNAATALALVKYKLLVLSGMLAVLRVTSPTCSFTLVTFPPTPAPKTVIIPLAVMFTPFPAVSA